MAHLRIKYGDWVFVGDGRKALLLRNEGDPDLLNLRRVEVREQDEHAPSGEQGAKAATPDRARTGAHSTTGNADWHALEEERFAITIAERLNRAAEEGQLKHIVIVAPPKVLGELRQEYSKKLQGMILGEIDKDLTHHTIPEIEKILGVRGV